MNIMTSQPPNKFGLL